MIDSHTEFRRRTVDAADRATLVIGSFSDQISDRRLTQSMRTTEYTVR
jgi:hypothetical protein